MHSLWHLGAHAVLYAPRPNPYLGNIKIKSTVKFHPREHLRSHKTTADRPGSHLKTMDIHSNTAITSYKIHILVIFQRGSRVTRQTTSKPQTYKKGTPSFVGVCARRLQNERNIVEEWQSHLKQLCKHLRHRTYLTSVISWRQRERNTESHWTNIYCSILWVWICARIVDAGKICLRKYIEIHETCSLERWTDEGKCGTY